MNQLPSALRLDEADLNAQCGSESEYRNSLSALQKKMADLQNAVYHNEHQVVLVLEGWDASGKGGAIRRLTEKLDPRSYRVHPITKPDAKESREHYLQRFWRKLPGNGNIAIFDRSWYGRVLVERVEGFASKTEWQRAYDEINHFEETLCSNGMILIKLMLHVSQEEQLRRYAERLNNPRKHWKLTKDDLRNRQNASDYRRAFDEMLERTSTDCSRWHIIPGEHKWYARIAVLNTVCTLLEATIDTRIPRFTDKEIAETKALLGISDK